MFKLHVNLLLFTIILCNTSYTVLHCANEVDDPFNTGYNKLKEDEKARNVSTIKKHESKEDPFVPNTLQNSYLKENVESAGELYNVTLTDINGQPLRIIVNRTVLDASESRRDVSFQQRAREDAFEKTTAAENPYAVLLISMNNDVVAGICSGSLLTREWVLTAAHCSEMGPTDAIVVYAGGYTVDELLKEKTAKGSQVSKSTEFYVHPEYSNTGIDADVSVVKAGPFELTDTVNLVKLSKEPWTYHSYKECKITGFGIVQINKQSKDDKTRKTHNLLVKNPCLCSFKLKSLVGAKKSKRFICAKPLQDYGVCPGDSGGGLVCDGQIKAVTMLLIQMRDVDVCDLAIFPPGGVQCGSKKALTIFQDTCPFLKWINSHVKLYNDSEISPKCVYTGSNANSIKTYFIFVIIFSTCTIITSI